MPDYKKLENQEADVENGQATGQDTEERQRPAESQQAAQMVTVSLLMLLFLGSSYFQVFKQSYIHTNILYLIH